MNTIETRLKERARSLGFDLAGIAPATPADGFDRYKEWLERGYAGEMAYLRNQSEPRRSPESILANVRSVVMVGMMYDNGPTFPDDGLGALTQPRSPVPGAPTQPQSPIGRVARYAQGPDYHQVMWAKLDTLLAWLQGEVAGLQGRGVVDSAPLLERDFARRAGLGWFGKNTMLINKKMGSFFFLGALLVDHEFQADSPHVSSHCGTCTACLDACPTEAFTGPGWLDARKCISYLTIELRSPIPELLRPGMRDWLYGCDICQEVCPWNRPFGESLAFDPIEILGLDEEEFRTRFRATAVWRAKRRGLLRNAAIVLGNTGDARALPALERAQTDAEPLIREAAAWAIGCIQERLSTPRTDFLMEPLPTTS